MQINKILLATDLSIASRQAYDHAAAIAERFEAKILFIHVNEAAGFSFQNSKNLIAYLDAIGERIRNQMAVEVKLLEDRGLDIEVVTASGLPSREIIKAAELNKVDLIVTTRRGKASARHLHFGSTARKLVLHTQVPLLIVPGEEGADGDFTGYHHVLTTTDFSEESDHGLQLCLDFAERFEAAVTLTHVLKLPNPLPSVPGEPPIFFPRESMDDLQSFHDRELSKLIEDAGADRLSYSLSINADIADGVMETAREVGVDLVVIPSHGKGAIRSAIFGSTSQRVLKLSTVPVLVYPRAYLQQFEDVGG